MNTFFRAAAPHATADVDLGALTELPGTWMGNGFNLIALPTVTDGPLPFRVLLNATDETLTFAPIGAPIPNRGSVSGSNGPSQCDITFLGLHYLQRVADAVTHEALHLETGQWLNLSDSGYEVVRLSTIPHGVSLIAQGRTSTISGAPTIAPVSILPTNVDDDTVPGAPYLRPYDEAPLPPGISREAVSDPNLILVDATRGQDIVETTILEVKAVSSDPFGKEETRDIVNTPYLKNFARVKDFSASFYIETVQRPGGEHFMQLQYTQTIVLEFLAINWPHVTIATLVKQ
jgi:hypothetical protein